VFSLPPFPFLVVELLDLRNFPSAHIAAHVHEESQSVCVFFFSLAKFRQKALLTHILAPSLLLNGKKKKNNPNKKLNQFALILNSPWDFI
jgi:hypothetical protein